MCVDAALHSGLGMQSTSLWEDKDSLPIGWNLLLRDGGLGLLGTEVVLDPTHLLSWCREPSRSPWSPLPCLIFTRFFPQNVIISHAALDLPTFPRCLWEKVEFFICNGSPLMTACQPLPWSLSFTGPLSRHSSQWAICRWISLSPAQRLLAVLMSPGGQTASGFSRIHLTHLKEAVSTLTPVQTRISLGTLPSCTATGSWHFAGCNGPAFLSVNSLRTKRVLFCSSTRLPAPLCRHLAHACWMEKWLRNKWKEQIYTHLQTKQTKKKKKTKQQKSNVKKSPHPCQIKKKKPKRFLLLSK